MMTEHLGTGYSFPNGTAVRPRDTWPFFAPWLTPRRSRTMAPRVSARAAGGCLVDKAGNTHRTGFADSRRPDVVRIRRSAPATTMRFGAAGESPRPCRAAFPAG